MKKFGLFSILLIFLICFGAYYVSLPALTLYSKELWCYLIFGSIIIGVIFTLYQKSVLSKIFYFLGAILLIVFVGLYIYASPIINANKYQALTTITERNFNEDIKQISYTDIPVLDKDSAIRLGDRKMGTLVDMVSQFEVSDLYTQINYKQKPTRVTPLEYANWFKYFSNFSKGIAAYITIDMTNQNVNVQRLNDGIKYSMSEHFFRYVPRYLRFKYPTYIFDQYRFEIDDDGNPYWICPVRDYTIGLFGGIQIKKVIILNAVTGETTKYNIDEVPTWVDNVYSANLLLSYYNYYGKLKNGWLNSVTSQKGCLQTTDGYNYIALDDDVWVYTGITSVNGDESNVGFVLMNQRTAEIRYYPISGAEEYSAMASAEGQVQHLGYSATFPLLLNIADQPTYFIALKDNAGLVKSYAMVNIEKYQIVAIGASVEECEFNYKKLLKENNISKEPEYEKAEITGIISQITQGVIDGNSHFYIMLENSDEIFDVTLSENYDILKYTIANEIKMVYNKGSEINKVISIE